MAALVIPNQVAELTDGPALIATVAAAASAAAAALQPDGDGSGLTNLPTPSGVLLLDGSRPMTGPIIVDQIRSTEDYAYVQYDSVYGMKLLDVIQFNWDGGANFPSIVVASGFQGDGSQLTNLPQPDWANLTVGITTSGIIQGSSFIGDGSQLTNLPAPDLSTALLLDGSQAMSANLNMNGSSIVNAADITCETIRNPYGSPFIQMGSSDTLTLAAPIVQLGGNTLDMGSGQIVNASAILGPVTFDTNGSASDVTIAGGDLLFAYGHGISMSGGLINFTGGSIGYNEGVDKIVINSDTAFQFNCFVAMDGNTLDLVNGDIEGVNNITAQMVFSNGANIAGDVAMNGYAINGIGSITPNTGIEIIGSIADGTALADFIAKACAFLGFTNSTTA